MESPLGLHEKHLAEQQAELRFSKKSMTHGTDTLALSQALGEDAGCPELVRMACKRQAPALALVRCFECC